MPSFKPKANKKIKVCKRYSTTLDGKHKEIMADFSKDEYDVIPRLKEEKQQLLQQISNSTLNSNTNSSSMANLDKTGSRHLALTL